MTGSLSSPLIMTPRRAWGNDGRQNLAIQCTGSKVISSKYFGWSRLVVAWPLLHQKVAFKGKWFAGNTDGYRASALQDALMGTEGESFGLEMQGRVEGVLC